jgi:chromosome segregation ATPase
MSQSLENLIKTVQAKRKQLELDLALAKHELAKSDEELRAMGIDLSNVDDAVDSLEREARELQEQIEKALEAINAGESGV